MKTLFTKKKIILKQFLNSRYGEHNCYDEIGFKRRLLMFLQENPFYAVDMKFNITLGIEIYKNRKIREINFPGKR